MKNKEIPYLREIKELINDDPVDFYHEDTDEASECVYELLESRPVPYGEARVDSTAIGSVNFLMATNHLAITSGLSLDTANVEILTQQWEGIIEALENERFLRKIPSKVRMGFKVVN